MAGAEAGALVVLADDALVPVEMKAGERGLERLWRVGPSGLPAGGEVFTELSHVWTGRSSRPWRPGHLRWTVQGELWRFNWVARGGEAWDDEWAIVDRLRFRVRVLVDGVEARRWEVLACQVDYGAEDRLNDLGETLPERLEVRVCQWGAGWGWGAEAKISLV